MFLIVNTENSHVRIVLMKTYVIIFIVIHTTIFLHKCGRRDLPIRDRWSADLFPMHIPTTKIFTSFQVLIGVLRGIDYV